MKLSFYFLIIIGGMFLASCEDYKDCNSPVETLAGIGFYHLVDGEEKDSTLPALTLYAPEKPDTVLAYKSATREIYVPLNPHQSSTQFFIQPDSTLSGGDTISIAHTNDLQFVSAGCGFTNFYKLDTVTTTYHYIDSIAIKNNEINTTNATNIKIYY